MFCTVTQIAESFRGLKHADRANYRDRTRDRTRDNERTKTDDVGADRLLSSSSSRVSRFSRIGSRALALATECGSSTVQRRIGVEREATGIDTYSKRTNTRVTARNDRDLRVTLTFCEGAGIDASPTLTVCGRPDGITDTQIVVEHKRRTRGLLGYVPFHERVQCHLYMHMLKLKTAHLVETFGTHMQIHVVPFDASVWDQIVRMLALLASDFDSSRTTTSNRWKTAYRHEPSTGPFANPRSDAPTFF